MSLALSVDAFIPQKCKEEFHQLLRNTTDKLSNNVYCTKDTMYHKTNLIRETNDIVIISGDKDNSIVIMNKKDYNMKIDDTIIEGIKELESFQSLLYQHFKNSPHYRKMLPSSHQPAGFFNTTAKTQKFESIKSIIIEYLKPLTKNELVITNIQQFPPMPNNLNFRWK